MISNFLIDFIHELITLNIILISPNMIPEEMWISVIS